MAGSQRLRSAPIATSQKGCQGVHLAVQHLTMNIAQGFVQMLLISGADFQTCQCSVTGTQCRAAVADKVRLPRQFVLKRANMKLWTTMGFP